MSVTNTKKVLGADALSTSSQSPPPKRKCFPMHLPRFHVHHKKKKNVLQLSISSPNTLYQGVGKGISQVNNTKTRKRHQEWENLFKKANAQCKSKHKEEFMKMNYIPRSESSPTSVPSRSYMPKTPTQSIEEKAANERTAALIAVGLAMFLFLVSLLIDKLNKV